MMYVMSSEGQNQQNEIKFIYILGVSTVAQQVNGLAMSQLWRRSQLQLEFVDPCNIYIFTKVLYSKYKD